MSKQMIPKEPWDVWEAKQKKLQAEMDEWEAGWKACKTQPERELYKRAHTNPRMPNGMSRWDQCNSFSNYDHTRWGPDDIDQSIDRLGIFEGLDFTDDIKIAEGNAIPTTWVDRTGTPEYRKPGTPHYPGATKADFDKLGLDIDKYFLFDSAPYGWACKAISDFIGMDYEKAQQGARRDYGYDLLHIQRPGQMLNYHYDTYYAIIRDVDSSMAWQPEKFRRMVVFLEDWQPGHIWITGNTTYSHWKKGECITWDWMHMPHGTANLSMNPRISLHLTGYMTEQSYRFYKEGHKDRRYIWNKETNTFDIKDL